MPINGAEKVISTLLGCGVDVCFANPGTSEMHLVAALDSVPGMRSVLVLFEGVATGAADGHARMTGRPAATLLHLGPGLGNALANLHNARKAGTPMVNIVGEHATYHRQYDAPLTSDIEAIASPMSDWVACCTSAEDVGPKIVASVSAASRPGRGIATLILPADCAWNDAGSKAAALPKPPTVASPDAERIRAAADHLRKGADTAFFVGGPGLVEPGLSIAARIAASTGARLIGPLVPNAAPGAPSSPAYPTPSTWLSR